MIEIIIKIPDNEANELEGLISVLSEFGKQLSATGVTKAPVQPKRRETKAEAQARVNARLNEKYNA